MTVPKWMSEAMAMFKVPETRSGRFVDVDLEGSKTRVQSVDVAAGDHAQADAHDGDEYDESGLMWVGGEAFREEIHERVRKPEDVHDNKQEEQMEHQGHVERAGADENIGDEAPGSPVEHAAEGISKDQEAEDDEKSGPRGWISRQGLPSPPEDIEIGQAIDPQSDEQKNNHLRCPHFENSASAGYSPILLNQAISSRGFRLVSEGGRLAGCPMARRQTILYFRGILSSFLVLRTLNQPIQHVERPNSSAWRTKCSPAIPMSRRRELRALKLAAEPMDKDIEPGQDHDQDRRLGREFGHRVDP